MAIIPRYTSRALPEGAQPGLVESAQSRGRAGARLAASAGGAIIAGVEYKERKDAEEAARVAEDGPGPASPKNIKSGAKATDALKSRIAAGRETVARQEVIRDGGKAIQLDANLAVTRAGGVTAGIGDEPADGLVARRMAEFDKQARKSVALLDKRPALKARADAIVASHAGPYEARLLKAQAELLPAEALAELDESLGLFAEAARLDPEGVDGYIGRGLKALEEMGETAGLPPEEIAEKQNRFAATAATAAMRGLIGRDPAATLERLEAGEFDAVFDKPVRNRLVQEAETAARARGAEAAAAVRARRRALELDVEEHLTALAETGAGDAALEARARAELPPEDYAAYQANQAAAGERYATRREYAFMTPQQMAEDIAAKAPGGRPWDAGERAAGDEIRQEVRDEILTARAADPAGWAMQDEDVAAAFAAAEENPDDPSLVRRAAELRLALQREMGVEQPRLLSEAERDAIAERLAATPPTQRLAEIRQLLTRHQDDFARVLAELGGRIDADTVRLASYVSSSGAAELLAKGMEKAHVNGPAKAEGDAPLLPMVATFGTAPGEIDLRGIRPFRQYILPDGDRVAHDGEALVPATTIQPAAAQTLTGGATLWRGSESGPRPTDWSGIIERIPRLSVRGAVGAAGAAALTLLTPWNAEDEYRYFGEGARLRTAPGDMYGTVQEFDADAGEWVETGLVGFAVSAGAGAPASVVTGTREQIDRVRADSLTAPDGQLPPSPPLIPPVVPDAGREEFPAERGAPMTHVTPSKPGAAETEILPIPEGGESQILVFPDMSKESIPYMVSENRKGNAETRAQIDYIRDRFLETYPGWKHIGGGRYRKDGSEMREHWVPGPGSAFPDEEGRKGDGRPGGKWADLTFKSPSGTVVHVQTVDVDKYGKPTDRELQNAEAIRRATRETVILIPKPGRR